MNLFYKFFKPYRSKIYLVIVSKLIIIACSVFVPYYLGRIISKLEKGEVDMQFLLISFSVFVLIYFFWDFLQIFIDITFENINKSIENDIREYCYRNIIYSPMSKFHNISEGELITKIIRDTEKIEKTFSNLFEFGVLIITTVGMVIMMFVTNVILASIVLALFLVIILSHKVLSRPLEKMYGAYKNSEELLLTDLRNQLTGFLTTKIFNLEGRSLKLLKTRNEENLSHHVKVGTKVSIIKNINFFISSLFRVLTVIIGGALYIVNLATIGQIFTLNTYAIQMTYSLRTLIDIDIILKDIKNSFKRIDDFIQEFNGGDQDGTIELENINYIKFDNVNFNYDEKPLFNNLNFKGEKGDVIAIKGSNGSGKTSLTYLICGFYKPHNIYYNEIPNSSVSEKEIMKHTSYALQNTHLFPDTVMNNLTCFKDKDTDKVIQVCKDIGLHKKIMSFSNGYETIVDEKNMNLSGGEKQLISLARALIKDTDVLILDEINSAIDVDTEKEIIENLPYYFKDKIVFIISHKKNIFQLCNKEIMLS